jgi:predicted PurR-regulated permease PerM
MVEISEDIRVRTGVTLLPPPGTKAPDATPKPEPKSGAVDPDDPNSATPPPEAAFDLQQLFAGDWLQGMLQDAGKRLLELMRNSLGGFLGVVGFLLSLIIVPIYLFYFLIEAPSIASQWHDYLPLRASAFKDEVVSVLNEINGYLIAFFRGQLVVSTINGAITGILLAVVRLEFGLLIGVALCFLGIVPYLGIAACWLIAVVLAVVQGGSWLVPEQPFWLFPLVVTCIFFVVHWLDNLFVTPRIVGESVGLHPFTVIFSVFVWSLLMGGLLGAILAVPLTATVKVLLRRYVWERSFRAPGGQVLPREPALALASNPPPAEPSVATP